MTRAGGARRVRPMSGSCALGAGGDCRLSCARCRRSSSS
nr:MAG TPA: hypothetical protein [Caudoviricetes sp.]